MRAHPLPLGQGWREQDDADELRQDAALRLGASERKSTGPVEPREGAPRGLTSQPALSLTMGMRVLQQVEGALFPNASWRVTRWKAQQMPAADLLEYYRQRGTTEAHILVAIPVVPAVPLLAVRAGFPGRLEVCPLHQPPLHSRPEPLRCRGTATLGE